MIYSHYFNTISCCFQHLICIVFIFCVLFLDNYLFWIIKKPQAEYIILHQLEGFQEQWGNLKKQGMLKNLTYPEYIYIFLKLTKISIK